MWRFELRTTVTVDKRRCQEVVVYTWTVDPMILTEVRHEKGLETVGQNKSKLSSLQTDTMSHRFHFKLVCFVFFH